MIRYCSVQYKRTYLNILLVAEAVGVMYPGLPGAVSGVADAASVEFNLASCRESWK